MPTLPPTFRSHLAPSGREVDKARGSARARGYDTRWDRESRAYKLANPLCLGCRAVGRVAQTEVTDHVVPHKGDPALMWSRANWQPSCKWHHDVVKQQLEAMWFKQSIDANDLRLDSPIAVKITKLNDRNTPGGA